MYFRPEDLARAHQSDLLEEACRDRRGARRVRAKRRPLDPDDNAPTDHN